MSTNGPTKGLLGLAWKKKLHHCSFFVHVSVFHDAHTMQPVPSVKVNARKDS